MIQTINLIKKEGSKRKIIAIANLELDTLQDEETIKESYENVLDDSLKKAQKKRGKATATDFLMIATKKVMKKYPDVILLSVNDDRRKGNQKTAINFEFFVK